MNHNDQELHYLTIRDAGDLIKTRQVSPVELTQALLDRIEFLDGDLRSYVTLTADEALLNAEEAELEIRNGDYRGPLHGIPLAHKDLYDTKGVRTTGQSKVLEDRVPTKNATVIQRLQDAGSILLGKLAMFEFAMGGPETSLFDQAKNPWNLEYVTSGSSSGSAAAVAAGLTLGSLGSDTGGSIRGPASYCGIVGLKPTYGRVSRCGVLPLSWSLDHCGPMTWTVEDAAIMLQVIAGYDPNDLSSSPIPVDNYVDALRVDVKDLVIGVPMDYCFDSESNIDGEIIGVVEGALKQLERLGARVEHVNIPSLEYAPLANNVIMLSEAFAYHLPNLKAQPQNYGEAFIKRLYMGGLFTANDYVEAQRIRSLITKEIGAVFENCHLIAMPTSNTVPVRLNDYKSDSWLHGPSFTAPFNQTGMPAISVPCGFTQSGLPIGLQLAGKPFDEMTVLRAAYTYQQHQGLHLQRPPY